MGSLNSVLFPLLHLDVEAWVVFLTRSRMCMMRVLDTNHIHTAPAFAVLCFFFLLVLPKSFYLNVGLTSKRQTEKTKLGRRGGDHRGPEPTVGMNYSMVAVGKRSGGTKLFVKLVGGGRMFREFSEEFWVFLVLAMLCHEGGTRTLVDVTRVSGCFEVL